jgi:hypothetical protein
MLRLQPFAVIAISPEGGLCRLDVCCLFALGTSGDVEGDALAFLEGFEAAGVDCRVMREEILATIFRCDEAKAFCVVEPFNCAGCHFLMLLIRGDISPHTFMVAGVICCGRRMAFEWQNESF